MSPPRILVVDDNIGDIELTRIAFEMANMDIEFNCAVDGLEAITTIDRAAADNQLPNLILLDLNMPRANGFEVLEHLHQHHLADKVPVVVLTTSQQGADYDRCMALGALAMYTKPSSVNDMYSLVEKLRTYLP